MFKFISFILFPFLTTSIHIDFANADEFQCWVGRTETGMVGRAVMEQCPLGQDTHCGTMSCFLGFDVATGYSIRCVGDGFKLYKSCAAHDQCDHFLDECKKEGGMHGMCSLCQDILCNDEDHKSFSDPQWPHWEKAARNFAEVVLDVNSSQTNVTAEKECNCENKGKLGHAIIGAVVLFALLLVVTAVVLLALYKSKYWPNVWPTWRSFTNS